MTTRDLHDQDSSMRRRCTSCFNFQQFCVCHSNRITIDDAIDAVAIAPFGAIEVTSRDDP